MQKKLLLITFVLASTVFSLMAQNTHNVMYVYRNDGQFNVFFRDEVDSIAYSNYDNDSVYHEEIVTQLIYSADSIYHIPLAAIDSISFETPETKYRQDVVQLDGTLFDYLISADSLLLLFSPSLPKDLVPKIDDKICTTELTDKLPYGFTGKVRSVESSDAGITVLCDSMALEEAVSQFYGVVDIMSEEVDGSVRHYLRRKAPVVDWDSGTRTFSIPNIRIPINFVGVFTPRNVFGIGGKASWTVDIKPKIIGRLIRVVDDRAHISYYCLHAVADVATKNTVEVAGVVNKDNFDFLRNAWVHRDIRTPWGISVYLAYGPILEARGEFAVGSTFYIDFRTTVDITFNPTTSPLYLIRNPIIRALFRADESVNTINHDTRITNIDADWNYFAARGGLRAGTAWRAGLSIVDHNIAWLGVEAQASIGCEAEISADFESIGAAEENTRFYEAIKNAKLGIKDYVGCQVVLGGLADHARLSCSPNFFRILHSHEYDFVPKFKDTKAWLNNKNTNGADVSSNIVNDCLFPYTVGFSLFDDDGNRVGNPQWNNQLYWGSNNPFYPFTQPYRATFIDLVSDKQYKVYPTFRLLGFNVLASPSADLDTHFPVNLSDFKVTNSQHQKRAFTHEGQQYDYRFDVTVTATLDDTAEGIEDWGYVYKDPNGRIVHISLKEFGRSKTDDRWAYFRNQARSTCILYGYVKYKNDENLYYQEEKHFDLIAPIDFEVKEEIYATAAHFYLDKASMGNAHYILHYSEYENIIQDEDIYFWGKEPLSTDDSHFIAHYLNPETTYYYCFSTIINGKHVYTEIKSFTTPKVVIYTGILGENEEDALYADAFVLCGSYYENVDEYSNIDEGYFNHISYGIIYNAGSDPLQNGEEIGESTHGSHIYNEKLFFCVPTLLPNTTYYYRAYVYSGLKTYYGDLQKIETPPLIDFGTVESCDGYEEMAHYADGHQWWEEAYYIYHDDAFFIISGIPKKSFNKYEHDNDNYAIVNNSPGVLIKDCGLLIDGNHISDCHYKRGLSFGYESSEIYGVVIPKSSTSPGLHTVCLYALLDDGKYYYGPTTTIVFPEE